MDDKEAVTINLWLIFPRSPGALAAADPSKNPLRIGVVSAAKTGKPRPRNGHIWHFAQGPHPVCDLDALKMHYPFGHKLFSNYFRNPKFNSDTLPFPDTRITHFYDADRTLVVPRLAEIDLLIIE